MRKRRAKGGEGGHERWLVSYADFITLMFAFFVVMFSAAHVEQQKVGKLARSIQGAFLELSIIPANGSRNMVRDLGQYPDWSLGRVEALASRPDQGWPHNNDRSPSHFMPGEGNPQQLREQLEKQLEPEKRKGLLRIALESRGLVISLAEAALFDSGSATVREQSLALVDRISKLLKNRRSAIRIEGHTDNVPIRTRRYASNWELSTARATFVLSYLADQGYQPARLSAAGYGEYRPVAANTSAEGRAMNRRVDIVVLNPQAMREEPSLPKSAQSSETHSSDSPASASEGTPAANAGTVPSAATSAPAHEGHAPANDSAQAEAQTTGASASDSDQTSPPTQENTPAEQADTDEAELDPTAPTAQEQRQELGTKPHKN